jgi:hypothetical protein
VKVEAGRNCHQAAYLRAAPRTKLWKKVMVRLAYLGWNTIDLLRETNPGWDSFSKNQTATARAIFSRKLNRGTFSDTELVGLESALNLQSGTLSSSRVGFSKLIK